MTNKHRSLKTLAHACHNARSDRFISVIGKPAFSLALKVDGSGKTFTLSCGQDAPIVVKSADHGGAGSVRSIADQMLARLAARSGASVDEMSIGDGPVAAPVKLDLEALTVSRKAK